MRTCGRWSSSSSRCTGRRDRATATPLALCRFARRNDPSASSFQVADSRSGRARASGNALAGSAATFRGPDRLPKPGSLDDARLAPFRLPRFTLRLQASGRQPAIQETSSSSCSIGASRPGLPAHPCVVTDDQPYREGRRPRAACTTDADISATAIQEDPAGCMYGNRAAGRRTPRTRTGHR
jgi:hypothetical protein